MCLWNFQKISPLSYSLEEETLELGLADAVWVDRFARCSSSPLPLSCDFLSLSVSSSSLLDIAVSSNVLYCSSSPSSTLGCSNSSLSEGGLDAVLYPQFAERSSVLIFLAGLWTSVD